MMFCPKCGGESIEGQKFCKACGANLQLVADALGHGDDTLGQLRVDFDLLKRNIADTVRNSVSYGKYGFTYRPRPRHRQKDAWKQWFVYDKSADWGSTAGRVGATTKGLAKEQNLTMQASQPLLPWAEGWEWIRYSRQHSLMRGLVSLFGGLAAGGVMYYLAQQLVQSGTLSDVENVSHVHGLAHIVTLLWIIAAIPVMKGLAQIIYALLFAEPISAMTARLVPPQTVTQTPPELDAPPIQINAQSPPPSVTEQTTNILGGPRQGVQNAQ